MPEVTFACVVEAEDDHEPTAPGVHRWVIETVPPVDDPPPFGIPLSVALSRADFVATKPGAVCVLRMSEPESQELHDVEIAQSLGTLAFVLRREQERVRNLQAELERFKTAAASAIGSDTPPRNA